ncbi:hypothetical protein BJ741DRAFT_603908 [Chytriomyces cf. hyalinus JEL632]|nr:hypothetical protein BJ741DRAFT_603908 [Chytriomyces cf. hyalinus JEL632]
MGRGKSDDVCASADTPTKRTVQVRLAQRAFRARKEERIKLLEQTVLDLTAQNRALLQAGPPKPPASCPTCTSQIGSHHPNVNQLIEENHRLRIESNLLRELLQQANSKMYAVEIKNPALIESHTRILESDKLGLNATTSSIHTFGGLCEVEQCREDLKKLPSLYQCRYVDDLCSLFLVTPDHCHTHIRKYLTIHSRVFTQAVANCEDKKIIKCMVTKMIAARYKILDACSSFDRREAIEVIERCKSKNKKHIEHMYQMTAVQLAEDTAFAPWKALNYDPSTSNASEGFVIKYSSGPSQVYMPDVNSRQHMLNRSQKFLDATKSIAALNGSRHLVENLCILFWSQALSTDKVEREAMFFELVDVFNRILWICQSEQSKTEFILSTEAGRASEKAVANQMLDEALSVNSLSGNLIDLL